MIPKTRATTGTNEPDNITMKEILGIPEAAMDHAMGIAYQLYLAGRLSEAETVCKGLIACDHLYWWSHSLHASVLRRLGRHEEALRAVEEGLRYEPRQPKLSLMRAELLITIGRKRATGCVPTSAAPPATADLPTTVRQNGDSRAATSSSLSL